MPERLLRSVLIGLIVRELLLTLMPSLHQWQLTPATRNDTADDSPVNCNAAVCRAIPAIINVYNRALNSTSHNRLTLGFRVIMDQRDYILTNKHVISGADQTIVAPQGGRVFEVPLVRSDTLADLAMLKIDATDGLPVISINPKHTPHISGVALVIGNPYNLGQTITQGIISATRRIGLNPTGRQNFLQTDTSVNHGSLGGALVNSLGELAGINTLSFGEGNDGETLEDTDFAIPFRLATKTMDELIRGGRVTRGYIGTSDRGVAPPHTQGGRISQIQEVVISDVASDGPAAQAGIRANDAIISMNDKPAVFALETMDQVTEIRPRSEIPVAIIRDNKRIMLYIAIQGYPATN